MSVPTTMPMSIRLRRKWLVTATVAAALAASGTATLLAVDRGTDRTAAAPSISKSQAAAAEKRYIRGITALTPAQRAAAFGTGR